MSFAVELTNVSKAFGAVKALDSVSLQVRSGSMHALVGENGAGKTTLMRILYGALVGDSGTLSIDGRESKFASVREANEAGIGMVSQHYAIIPELTCLQNLMLGAEGSAVLSLSKARARAQSLAEKMDFRFDWDATADTLSPASAQKLEILKLLWRDARIMILDEPTAMLSPADSSALFESLQQLREQGATIILVTHRLPEVIDFCESVTVLRGGRWIATYPVNETNPAMLAELIVGEKLQDAPPLEPVPPGEARLEFKDLMVVGDKKQLSVNNAQMRVEAGEIVGIAGVDGSGQRELVHAILGTRKIEAGEFRVLGLDSKSTTRARLASGLRLVAEDRLNEAVLEGWSLVENGALGLQSQAPMADGIWIDRLGKEKAVKSMAERFQTKHGGIHHPISSLSGGNQQRFVAGRALYGSPNLIVAFQPARGLDLKGTADVYSGIRQACRGGAGALIVSFDLDELLEYCDRIVVMFNGQVTSPRGDRARDRETIGRLMVGAA